MYIKSIDRKEEKRKKVKTLRRKTPSERARAMSGNNETVVSSVTMSSSMPGAGNEGLCVSAPPSKKRRLGEEQQTVVDKTDKEVNGHDFQSAVILIEEFQRAERDKQNKREQDEKQFEKSFAIAISMADALFQLQHTDFVTALVITSHPARQTFREAAGSDSEILLQGNEIMRQLLVDRNRRLSLENSANQRKSVEFSLNQTEKKDKKR